MGLIGTEIAKMHLADIIHGDLTTSNMMLRHPSSLTAGAQTELVSFHFMLFSSVVIPLSAKVLIDFGLSYVSNLVEDRAVDLYVLERAFSSTHPDSEPMFSSVLSAYATQVGKEWSAIGKRLDDGKCKVVSFLLLPVKIVYLKCDYEGGNGAWLDETSVMILVVTI